jgi:hypothetical protein
MKMMYAKSNRVSNENDVIKSRFLQTLRAVQILNSVYGSKKKYGTLENSNKNGLQTLRAVQILNSSQSL